MSKTPGDEREQVKTTEEKETTQRSIGATGNVRMTSLHLKLLELRKSAAPITSNVKGSEFNFPNIEKVIASIRPMMDELKILLKEETIGSVVHPIGDGRLHVKAQMRFTWIDAENPDDREECIWEGHGIDNNERTIGQAQTYGEKNFLLKNLQIPVNRDDPDSKQKSVVGTQNTTMPMAQAVPPPPSQEPPKSTVDTSWVDAICIGLKSRKDWDKAWGIMQKSDQLKTLPNAYAMDVCIARFDTLFKAWNSSSMPPAPEDNLPF